MSHVVLSTRFGDVTLSWNGSKLQEIRLEKFAPRNDGDVLIDGEPPDEEGAKLVQEMRAYFEGKARTFSVSVDTNGYTPFQRKVWEVTREIPSGEVRTYGEIARKVGRPNGARAVGGALGRNPFPIVIPCHRVVGANRALTGFGAGLAWKGALLNWEGVETFKR